MIDLNEVYSLTEFQRNAKEHIDRLSKTRTPHVLTVNGKAAVVVVDPTAYQELLEAKERAEAIAGIQRGLDAMKRGETRPLSEVLDDLKNRHESP